MLELYYIERGLLTVEPVRNEEMLGINDFSIIALMTIENRALSLARSFALSRYNHRAVVIALGRLAVFKMAARFFDVSGSEIDQ